MAEALLVKYSVLHGVSGHQDGDIVKREMEHHFPRSIPPTEKKSKKMVCFLQQAQQKRDCILLSTL